MSETVIQVENVSKLYRLGEVGTGSLAHDVNRWWHRVRGKEDPYRKVGETNEREQKGDSDYAWALRGVSFEVKRGEVLGIIGRNGAGKSTLLKILSRITSQTEGRIKIKGRIASLLEVGTGFHPELTGRENIFLNGAILGMRKAEIARKFEEIVEFSGCARYIDTPVKRYSSGMSVRLAFAVAAHLEPEILIVDEVLAVGDAEFQKKCLGKMKDVAGHGRTILFVSHNMSSIAALCQKGIFMNNGTVELTGSIDSVIKRYIEKSSVGNDSTVEELRLPGMGEDLVFTSIEMAKKQTKVFYGSPLVFDLRIESKKDFKNLSVASNIMNRSGICVGALFSKFCFDIKAGEKKLVRLSIKNHKLAPDRYHAGFSIGQGGFDNHRHDLDIVVGKPYFEILPHSENHTYITWRSTNWGSIHFDDNEAEIIK